jgi:hypothetical protein
MDNEMPEMDYSNYEYVDIEENTDILKSILKTDNLDELTTCCCCPAFCGCWKLSRPNLNMEEGKDMDELLKIIYAENEEVESSTSCCSIISRLFNCFSSSSKDKEEIDGANIFLNDKDYRLHTSLKPNSFNYYRKYYQ